MRNPATTAQAHAQRAAHEVSPWVERLARIGYAAKGIVYMIVGALALDAAFGAGGQTTGSKGAIRTIAEQSYGQVLLTLVALGLFGYALWKAVQATLDPDGKGSDGEGWAKRIGYAASSVMHVTLALYALSLAYGFGGGGSGGGTQSLTAKVLANPLGKWLIILVGVGVLVYAFRELYKAWSGDLSDHIHLESLDHRVRTWVRRAGRLGHGARGVVFALIGVFLVQAGWQSSSGEARGLEGALDTIAAQSAWLLALVALGLFCYGAFAMVKARYRSFNV